MPSPRAARELTAQRGAGERAGAVLARRDRSRGRAASSASRSAPRSAHAGAGASSRATSRPARRPGGSSRSSARTTSSTRALLDALCIPSVVHFGGHLLATEDGLRRPRRARAPARSRAEIDAFLDERNVGFAYGSLAVGRRHPLRRGSAGARRRAARVLALRCRRIRRDVQWPTPATSGCAAFTPASNGRRIGHDRRRRPLSRRRRVVRVLRAHRDGPRVDPRRVPHAPTSSSLRCGTGRAPAWSAAPARRCRPG